MNITWNDAGWALVGVIVVFVCIPIVQGLLKLRQPHNYRSLLLTGSGLEYENLSGQKWSVPWREITSVTFYRGEDPWAQAYSETMWLIRRPCGETIESIQIVHEWSNRRGLLRAFAQHIPGFDIREAKRGMRTRKRGYWMCFPSLEKARNAEARERAPVAKT